MNFTNKHTGLLQCDSKSELLFLRSDFFMCGYKEYVLLFAWETCFRLSLQNSWGKLYSFLNSPKRHLFTSSRGKCDSRQNMMPWKYTNNGSFWVASKFNLGRCFCMEIEGYDFQRWPSLFVEAIEFEGREKRRWKRRDILEI